MEAERRKRARRTTVTAQRACLECQRRKTRCITSPDRSVACTYCKSAGKDCAFEAAPERTPLTRKNLDATERRCQQLESLIRSLDPQIDIDSALRNLGHDPQIKIKTTTRRSSISSTASDEYEWHEKSLSAPADQANEQSNERDGMATLPIKGQEAGYLGSSSGSSLLQAISSLLSPTEMFVPEDSVRGSREHMPQAQAPQPAANLHFNQRLTTSGIVNHLVDAYFLYYNSSYPILHEPTFRDIYKKNQSRASKPSFQIIFYMVLAFGDWLSSTDPAAARAPYYPAARSLITVKTLEAGTLSTVQALLLMGNYLQKMDRPNTGYNLIGIAHRMSLGLGLHREVPSRPEKDILASERRRRAFWVLYCFDSGFSITTGRPTTIPDSFIDVRLPRNVDDSGCTLTSLVPAEVDYPTPYSAIIEQSKLSTIANEIHSGMMSTKAFYAGTGQHFALKMDQKLLTWRNSLAPYFDFETIPDWFRGPRAVILWKQQNLRILLWQAVERNPSMGPDKLASRHNCGMVALEAVQSIISFCRQYPGLVHPGLSWYATYFLFQATLVLLLFGLQEMGSDQSQPLSSPGHGDSPWMQGVAKARAHLESLGRTNKAATRCLNVLDRVSGTVSSMSPEVPVTSGIPHLDGQTPTLPVDQQEEASPNNAMIFGDHWSTAADPSLSMVLGDPSIWGSFQDFTGFPGTVENDYFDYVDYSIYNNAGTFGPSNVS